jgi:hypothetical protein
MTQSSLTTHDAEICLSQHGYPRVTFRLGLVMLRKRLVRTTIGTVFVHIVILPSHACYLAAVM